jgi:hypothetical protein
MEGWIGRAMQRGIVQLLYFTDGIMGNWFMVTGLGVESGWEARSLTFKSKTFFMTLCCFPKRSCLCHWKIVSWIPWNRIIVPLFPILFHWKHSHCLPIFGQVWASLCFSEEVSVLVFVSYPSDEKPSFARFAFRVSDHLEAREREEGKADKWNQKVIVMSCC